MRRSERFLESGDRKVQKCREVKNGEWSVVKWSDVKGSEVTILGEMSVLSLIYSYVTLCKFCVVNDLIIIWFSLLFSNYFTYVFQYSFLCLFSVLYFFLFGIFWVLVFFLYCFVYCFSFCAVSFLFLYSLPTTAIGWKSNWSKKYHISFHIKTQKLSTCNDVSVTWVAEVSWMDLHQPWFRNKHSAVFLCTNLNQHFAYMFTSRHVPATELLHVSTWFSDNSNVIFDISLW